MLWAALLAAAAATAAARAARRFSSSSFCAASASRAACSASSTRSGRLGLPLLEDHFQRGRIRGQAAHDLSVGDRGQADLARPVAGNDPAAVVRGGDFHDQFAEGLELANLVASAVPEFDRAIAAAGDEPPVVQELQRRYTARMGRDVLDPLAVFHGPKGDRAVFAGRGQDVRVVAPTHGRDRRLVALQGLELAIGAGLPDPDAAGPIGRGQQARRRD